MFERSLRDRIADNARITNLQHSIAGKQDRPNPGSNRVSPTAGFSGEDTFRKMRDGSVHHGMKYGNDWYYRRYTKSGEDEWDITELIGVERIQSTIFYQNLYSGRGWGVTPNDKGDYTLEIDNLIVRRNMIIWEMVINQLRASNGTFIVGSSAKIADTTFSVTLTGSNQYDIIFESSSSTADTQPFKVGDVIACKRFWMQEAPPVTTEQVVATVNEISIGGNHLKISITVDVINSHILGKPVAGLEFVRVASTVAGRQGLVVFSSDGNTMGDDTEVSTPFIDVYDGLVTFENFLSALGGDTDFIKVRMGRLDQLTGATDEFGLWANVVHLVGAGIEGANQIRVGTIAEMNAYDTSLLRNNDWWIATDEKNNVYSWDATGEVWVDRVDVGIQDAQDSADWAQTIIDYTIDDGIIVSSEKEAIRLHWNLIESEYINYITEAGLFGVSTTDYTNAYDALDTYLHTTLDIDGTWSYKKNINPTTWNLKWNTYYDELSLLANAITDAVELLIPTDEDGKLRNTPNTGSAGLYLGSVNMGYHDGGVNWLTYMDNTGNFYLGGTGGKLRWNSSTNALYIAGEVHITNPGDIDTSTLTNDENWTDDTTADQAIQDALDAQTDATQALVDAQDAQEDVDIVGVIVDDMNDDGLLMPTEIAILSPIWDKVVAEATLTTGTIPIQALLFGVDDSDFDTAYANLYNYIITTISNPFLPFPYVKTTVGRVLWDDFWEAYYNERQLLLNAIAKEAKDRADDAQTDADTAISGVASNANDIFTNQYGKVDKPPNTASGVGLYLGSTHLGYYNGTVWKTYMSNTGNFYLGGTSGKLQWNGSALYISGQLIMEAGSTVQWSYVNDDGNMPDDNADVTLSELNGGLAVTGTGLNLTGTSSAIKSGKLAYGDTNEGWWLGRSSGVPRFHFGNSGDTQYLKWDGSNLIMSGKILVASGEIFSAFELETNGYIHTVGKGSPLSATDGVYIGYWGSGTTQVFACGNATKYLYYNASTGNLLIEGGDIATSTLIGNTIKTASSSDRVEITTAGLRLYNVTGTYHGQVQLYHNSTQIGAIGCNVSGAYFSAGATYDISIDASDDLNLIFGNYIKLSNLPTSNPGTTGRLYTQTATQLGGSGTEKVVCIV